MGVFGFDGVVRLTYGLAPLDEIRAADRPVDGEPVTMLLGYQGHSAGLLNQMVSRVDS